VDEPSLNAVEIPDKNLKKILVDAVGSKNNEVTMEELKQITEPSKDCLDYIRSDSYDELVKYS
jgi:hypothetical protein